VNHSADQPGPETGLRVDKWLWAARFFKTRGLAAEAIASGKVEINGTRVKPAKLVRMGDRMTVRRGPYVYALEVLALSARRGPASEAEKLYLETAQSRLARETLSAQLKRDVQPHPLGRPSKRDRRRIVSFTGKGTG
jgi:ribosome-associated heat shock protein Hsp15